MANQQQLQVKPGTIFVPPQDASGSPILYYDEANPASRMVLMLLSIMDAPVELKLIKTLESNRLSASIDSINVCYVPTFVHDAMTLTSCHAILIYICEEWRNKENSNLLPSNTCMRTRVLNRLFFNDSIALKRHSELMTNIICQGYENIDHEFHRQRVLKLYEMLELFLQDNIYLAGGELTLADIAMVATVGALDLYVPLDETGNKYPKLMAWYSNLRALPWYAANVQGLEKQREVLENFGQFKFPNNQVEISKESKGSGKDSILKDDLKQVSSPQSSLLDRGTRNSLRSSIYRKSINNKPTENNQQRKISTSIGCKCSTGKGEKDKICTRRSSTLKEAKQDSVGYKRMPENPKSSQDSEERKMPMIIGCRCSTGKGEKDKIGTRRSSTLKEPKRDSVKSKGMPENPKASKCASKAQSSKSIEKGQIIRRKTETITLNEIKPQEKEQEKNGCIGSSEAKEKSTNQENKEENIPQQESPVKVSTEVISEQDKEEEEDISMQETLTEVIEKQDGVEDDAREQEVSTSPGCACSTKATAEEDVDQILSVLNEEIIYSESNDRINALEAELKVSELDAETEISTQGFEAEDVQIDVIASDNVLSPNKDDQHLAISKEDDQIFLNASEQMLESKEEEVKVSEDDKNSSACGKKAVKDEKTVEEEKHSRKSNVYGTSCSSDARRKSSTATRSKNLERLRNAKSTKQDALAVRGHQCCLHRRDDKEEGGAGKNNNISINIGLSCTASPSKATICAAILNIQSNAMKSSNESSCDPFEDLDDCSVDDDPYLRELNKCDDDEAVIDDGTSDYTLKLLNKMETCDGCNNKQKLQPTNYKQTVAQEEQSKSCKDEIECRVCNICRKVKYPSKKLSKLSGIAK